MKTLTLFVNTARMWFLPYLARQFLQRMANPEFEREITEVRQVICVRDQESGRSPSVNVTDAMGCVIQASWYLEGNTALDEEQLAAKVRPLIDQAKKLLGMKA